MKKVLIITYLFHASSRIPGLCKFLKDFGWEATILTSPLDQQTKERLTVSGLHNRIIEVPHKDVVKFWKGFVGFKRNESILAQLEHKSTRKTKSWLYHLFIWAGTFLAYPDEMRSWRSPAIKVGKNILNNEKFDAILSSSFPVTSHRIALALNKYSSIPWLTDLRDLWTQNHNYLYPWRKLLETRLEIKTLSKSKLLSTVSESLALKLKRRYPNKKICVISNGFDPSLINLPPAPLTKEFTITYTGFTYQGKQDPAKIFTALRELFAENLMDRSKVRLRYYGAIQKWMLQLATGLEDIIVQYGSVFHDDAIIKQRESQVLLMYGWEDEYETGVLPLKMFEYFATRRPILATGGTPNEQYRTILDATKAGHHAIDIPGIKKILLDYYYDYLNSGSVQYHGIPAEMNKYSHREMASQFSIALNELTRDHNQVSHQRN